MESKTVSESPAPVPELRTQRLLLRQFRPDDADRIHHLVNDKEVAYTTHYIPYPYPDGAAEEWLKEHAELVRVGRAAVFAICVQEPASDSSAVAEPTLIGTAGLAIADLDHRAELGYWLGREYWGQGYCTEAVAKVVEFGFDHIGLHRIFATHIQRNAASANVLKKNGFIREGVLRQHARKWGVFEDVICYGMLDSDPRLGDTGITT